jgi:hypothetical protein
MHTPYHSIIRSPGDRRIKARSNSCAGASLPRLSAPTGDDTTLMPHGFVVDSPSYVPGYPTFKRLTYGPKRPSILVRPSGGCSSRSEFDANWTSYPVFGGDDNDANDANDDVSWCTGDSHGACGDDAMDAPYQADVDLIAAVQDASAKLALKRACPHMDKLDTFAVYTLWHMSCGAQEVSRYEHLLARSSLHAYACPVCDLVALTSACFPMTSSSIIHDLSTNVAC